MIILPKKNRVFIFLAFLLFSCSNAQTKQIIPAADQPDLYLPLLKNKSVGVYTNQTGRVGDKYLVDFLLENNIKVIKIFSPEHGFRGNNEDGKEIQDDKDAKTGIPILSVYGKKKKPSVLDLAGLDILVFDIQDVGVRFYTFISSMSYAMEAAAENGIPFVILDRPNPNGFYVDGPVLKTEFKSFIGLHPVPVVYGMTIGEYARMVKGEKWINQATELTLTVIPLANYSHDKKYELPVAPSPNLPNSRSIYLYPSICYFEGAEVSVGRGTSKPFQLIGYPESPVGDTVFTPQSISGASLNPPFKNQLCKGFDLSRISVKELQNRTSINWEFVWEMYKAHKGNPFFKANNYFGLLAGSDLLRKSLENGLSIEDFRALYQTDLNDFLKIRAKYLMYE